MRAFRPSVKTSGKPNVAEVAVVPDWRTHQSLYDFPPHHDHDRVYSAKMTSVSKAERAYIQAALHSTPPLRADGRGLTDFRTVFLETGVAPLANGSARVNVGKAAQEGGGGTEVIAAVKLEVEDVQFGDGIDGGRIVCNVSWCALLVECAYSCITEE